MSTETAAQTVPAATNGDASVNAAQAEGKNDPCDAKEATMLMESYRTTSLHRESRLRDPGGRVEELLQGVPCVCHIITLSSLILLAVLTFKQ